ncbi:MAG: RNase adaptor protein RapZ, partial [Elusimicrobiales bacterium]|nr:RNase adaptor protein RapZ [Elusimicrobiales bacterium]
MNKIKVFIVTGMSGAGKSQALKCFEDFGFYCIDNLPTDLMPFFAKLLDAKKYLRNVALGMDIREGKYLKDFVSSLENLIRLGIDCKIIFLDASDFILLQRFSETRHKHPLGKNLSRAIKQERRILSNLKSASNKVIDTSRLTLGELKEI